MGELEIRDLLIGKGLSVESHLARMLNGGLFDVGCILDDLQSVGIDVGAYVDEVSFTVSEHVRSLPDTNNGNEAARFYRAMISVTRAQLVKALQVIITNTNNKDL